MPLSDVDTSSLPQELRSLVDSELQSNERIIWLGQPIPWRVARTVLPVFLFGILWTPWMTAWTVALAFGTRYDERWFERAFPLVGVPLILSGLWMLYSPFWARRRAQRCAYVLTDRRAFILRAGRRGTVRVQSFEPERLTELRRKQHSDGSGDLVFTLGPGREGEGARHSGDVGFLAIPSVQEVEEKVRALVQSTRQ